MDPVQAQQAPALQQALTIIPTAPIFHLRLPILDEYRPSTERTKPLTDIYNGTCAGTKRDVQDVAFKNAMKHLYTLQGEVTDEQIIANLLPDTNDGQVSKGDMRYARTFISALQSQNFSSGKGWMITKLESEIAWEDFKTVLFNAVRLAHISNRRTEDVSDAQFDANHDAAADLLAKVAAAKGRTVAKIRTEIKHIENDTISILRYDKRDEAGFTDSALNRLKNREIERLEGLISSLEAWPESEFPEGVLDGADPDLLGDARLTFTECSPSVRKEFYQTFAESRHILVSANQATADSIEFLQSLDQAPFMAWKREQFCHVAECMFEHIIRHRIAEKQALYIDDFEQRQAAQANIPRPKPQTYLKAVRSFFNKYNASAELRGGQPPVGLQHMLVNGHAWLGSTPDRTSYANVSPPNAALLAPLPESFTMLF
ncbi:unnamed protein product [Zymoseptoria tritici ST99CH_1A5]|uniref:Uncharacterized protein n=1 Tax=Zymoseptoria tritici ST99CH_1A5 TaxID=1276529 RepID=A0A1Y6L7U9_ZYMTR|nr:unnamed protein product [Zymoseptoria tritici ST99CH_1A5]